MAVSKSLGHTGKISRSSPQLWFGAGAGVGILGWVVVGSDDCFIRYSDEYTHAYVVKARKLNVSQNVNLEKGSR